MLDYDPRNRPNAYNIDKWFEDLQKAIELHSMDYIAKNFLICNEINASTLDEADEQTKKLPFDFSNCSQPPPKIFRILRS
ncbi:3276_t:CDS:2 [Funneliformis caledonium]|uniref:3276_t:CDS:1 n=1 Tax=Funneliformis caledonium TaxID=1117310 RepID=A0A9N9HEL4_9GLOM|nr:3276_t:CDS:2 [Funneliformis caledonium]